MRSIYRIRGVNLAIIGVLLGVMLALSPGRALAESLDVLTIGGSNFFLDETVTSQITVTLPLLPGEVPTANLIFSLIDTDPLTGLPLTGGFFGTLQASDALFVSSSFIGEVQVGCQPIPFGCVPIFQPQFAQSITLQSDPDLSPLFLVSPDSPHALESAGGNFIGTFGSLGQVFVTSDIDAPNVPEPSTWLLLLLGCGVAGLAAWQRKRESKRQ